MFLVDSHVLLWWFGGFDRIGLKTMARIRQPNASHYSAATIMELTIKTMQGKLTIPVDFAARVGASGFIALPVRSEHASALRDFPELNHRDPFDRILLAQAMVERLTFLTADRRLLALGYDWIVDATV